MVILGKYNSPAPTDDLALCIKRASKFYNLARLKDVPEARRKLVLNYIEDAKSLQALAASAAAAPAGPPGPPGMPMPPGATMPPGAGAPPGPPPPDAGAGLPPQIAA